VKNYQKTFKDWNFRHDMSERVFIIHGWSGSPDEPLLKWLREELESKDIDVVALKMPETDEPKVNYWINFLAKEVGGIDEGTYFIGHSMGCQAIMRYLEMVKGNKRAGGAVFIAPWLHLTNLDEDDVEVPVCDTGGICTYTFKIHVIDLINNKRLIYESKPFDVVLDEAIENL